VKEVILHVGHGKTGSSHLQSVFALNVPLLNRNGIAYPFHSSFEIASRGFISSGNGEKLSLANIEAHEQNKVLFSGEFLFAQLLNTVLLSSLARDYKLRVVLYTRNVVEHALSRWAQGVKRGGVTSDVDSYLCSNPVGPHRLVLEWINQSKLLGFDLIIKNYTNNKRDLTSSFLKFALNDEIDSCSLTFPFSENINRSLTKSEYEVQRVFNAAFGKKSSEYLSDFLVNEFPRFPAHPIKISRTTYVRLVEENSEYVDKINDYLDFDDRISFGIECDFIEEANNVGFSTEAVELLGKNIKEHFSRIAYQDEDVDLLRDTALKIQSGMHLNLSDALALMQIALRNRPDGPLINEKVKDWTEQLKSGSNNRVVRR